MSLCLCCEMCSTTEIGQRLKKSDVIDPFESTDDHIVDKLCWFLFPVSEWSQNLAISIAQASFSLATLVDLNKSEN